MFEYWVAGGIVALGLILFLFLTSRTSYKQPTVRETSGVGYRRMRDEVTLEDADDGAEDTGEDGADEDAEEEYCQECEAPLSECTCEQAERELSATSSIGKYIVAIIVIGVILWAGVVFLRPVADAVGSVGAGANYTSADHITVATAGIASAVAEWLDLIVLVIVLGVLINIFIKMGNVFGTGPYEDKPTRKRASPKQKNKAIKHYEGMRNEMTSASAKRDKAKLERLRREGEQ